MQYRSVKELQKQRQGTPPPIDGAAGGGLAQDASSGLAMKMSKLKALSDADKDLITTLQQRIDEQRVELESRTAMVEAVQRNFENLSNMAVKEREELQRLRSQEEEREAEIRALQVTIKSLQADLAALREQQAAHAAATPAAAQADATQVEKAAGVRPAHVPSAKRRGTVDDRGDGIEDERFEPAHFEAVERRSVPR